MMKRILSAIMLAVLLVTLMPVPGRAATDLPAQIFLEQEAKSSCTLSTSAMMLRGRMYLSGNSNWDQITESAIKPYAWCDAGLLWNWSYTVAGNTIRVSHENLSGITIAGLKAIVDKHPEGIVLHCKSVPHSVLLTDYEGDTFYCADPASWYSGERIRLDGSYLGARLGSQDSILRQVSAYWYVASYSIKSEYYTVRYDANGGSGAPDPTYAYGSSGGTLSSAVPVYPGYIFQGWSEYSGASEAAYAPGGYIYPDQDVTLYAVWQKDPRPFTDIETTDYFYDAIVWAVENNITSGTSATSFSPNAPCTRAQVVTFLYRAAGEPAVSGSTGAFTDVPSGEYYSDAVSWAVANGITTGTGDGTTFSPDLNCTRAQVVTFLQRFVGGMSYSGARPFIDVPLEAWYADAVLWAVENGITTGTGDGTTFSPDADCTRGQIVTFLYRAVG